MKSKNSIEKYHPLIIVAIVFIVYIYPVLHCDFIWDSKLQIENNPIVNGKLPLYKAFSFGYWKPIKTMKGDYYRPAVIFILAIEKKVFGEKKALYHFVNLFLFIFSLVLLYRILNFYFSKNISFLMTLIFSLHPVNSDNVFWIVSLGDLISMNLVFSVFFLLKRKWGNDFKIKYLLFVFFLILSFGLLAKETFLIYSIVIFFTIYLEGKFEKKVFFVAIFSFAVSMFFYFFLKHFASLNKLSIKFILPGKAPESIVANILKTLGFYFKTAVFPFNYGLFSDLFYLKKELLFWGVCFLTFSFAIIFFEFSKKRSERYFFLALFLLFFVHLSPIFFPIFPYRIYSRYSYFLALSVSILIGMILTKFSKRNYIIFAILILFAFQINITGLYYRNNLNFWKKAYGDLLREPFSTVMYGNHLFKSGNYREAEKILKKALKYRLKDPRTAFILAVRLSDIEFLKGNYGEAIRWLNSIKPLIEKGSYMEKILEEKKNIVKNFILKQEKNINR